MLVTRFILLCLFLLSYLIETNKASIPFVNPTSKILFSSDSKMYLTGKTNVGLYTCDCETPQVYIPLCFDFQNQKAVFQNIRMKISTSNIECHRDLYNYNLKKGLESDKFPFISIDLLEAWKSDYSMFMNETQWFDVIANTNLTIKDTKQNKQIFAQGIRISPNKYRIKGSQTLSMKDYNVVVPQILFGLVQVEDYIVFHFDLSIEIIE